MAKSGNFPRLLLALEAVKLIDESVSLEFPHSKLPSKSAPALRASIPRPPTTAPPIKRHPRTCSKPSLIKTKEELPDSSRIRVDSARLFEKLAEILPSPHEKTRDKSGAERDDETVHLDVMNAVASCTERKDPPEIDYFVRRAYSSSVKGKDMRKILLKAKASAPPPLDDDPGMIYYSFDLLKSL
jgi:hypothetical protein